MTPLERIAYQFATHFDMYRCQSGKFDVEDAIKLEGHLAGLVCELVGHDIRKHTVTPRMDYCDRCEQLASVIGDNVAGVLPPYEPPASIVAQFLDPLEA